MAGLCPRVRCNDAWERFTDRHIRAAVKGDRELRVGGREGVAIQNQVLEDPIAPT